MFVMASEEAAIQAGGAPPCFLETATTVGASPLRLRSPETERVSRLVSDSTDGRHTVLCSGQALGFFARVEPRTYALSGFWLEGPYCPPFRSSRNSQHSESRSLGAGNLVALLADTKLGHPKKRRQQESRRGRKTWSPSAACTAL